MSRRVETSRRAQVALGLMLITVALLVLPFDIPILLQALADSQPLIMWLQLFNADTTPYFLWLLVLPLVLLLPAGWFQGYKLSPMTSTSESTRPMNAWLTSGAIGLVAFVNLALVASYLQGLPPAVHDEYSYLFQAETFLEGRLTNPGLGEHRQLVDMMHVLNISEGHFASRYFPGVGLWLAPFVALDAPYVANWVACALTAMLAFGIGRELGGYWVGVVAGLLTACSPTIEFFSNMILSHHPTLLGLYVFIFCLLRFWKFGLPADLLVATAGLTLGMLSRPLTALAMCVPFAIAYLAWFVRESRQQRFVSASVSTGLFLAPILLGLGFLLVYNHATTGSWTTTPYSQYTSYYSPRHVFGFDNRTRGEAWIAKAQAENIPIDVIDNYDKWTENLDVPLAWKNTKNRIVSNLKWTWGIVPLVASLVIFVVLHFDDKTPAWLLLASVVSLYVFHIPYWFDGMFHYHYVYEAGPLLLVIAAISIVDVWRATTMPSNSEATQKSARFTFLVRPQMFCWFTGLFLFAWITTHTSLEPLWKSWLHQGLGNLQFARGQHAQMNMILERSVQKPAVAIIHHNPSDRHLDYVVNSPRLDDPILRVRYLPETYPPERVAELFPDRYVYLLDLVEQKITPVAHPRR